MNESSVFVFGRHNLFTEKFSTYKHAGWDIHPAYSLWPKVQLSLFLSDPTAVKEVCSMRTVFQKPTRQYELLNFYGRNIVSSEGDEWKKFRKLCAPAFSERNNQLVWDETAKIMLDLFENVWQNRDTIVVDHCLNVTLPVALQVIGIAGFGMKMTMTEQHDTPPPGHQLNFLEALQIASEDVSLRLIIGDWCPNFTNRIRRVRLAFNELKLYMAEMIRSKRADHKESYDLFSGLLTANEDEDILSDPELMGNIFIFLVAGHETTAHTLCYALALLALHPDEQRKVYEQTKSLCPLDRIPTYQEMNKFTRVTAAYQEALRLFPAVIGIPKECTQDTALSTTNAAGETLTYPVPQGTSLVIHTVGMHHNPRYWKDPEQFNPDRFLGDWPRDAFLPFSAGARSCLGKKFFETEVTIIMALLILRYNITVTEEPQFAHESSEERKERVLDSMTGITLTPKRVPLTFTRRHRDRDPL